MAICVSVMAADETIDPPVIAVRRRKARASSRSRTSSRFRSSQCRLQPGESLHTPSWPQSSISLRCRIFGNAPLHVVVAPLPRLGARGVAAALGVVVDGDRVALVELAHERGRAVVERLRRSVDGYVSL